jgi:NAD(P) transhydrogenase subunit alpha
VKVLIPRERDAGETRVASSPEVVKRLTGRHVQCRVERGAGQQAGFSDEAYATAGAELVNEDDNTAWAESDIVLSVGPLGNTTPPLRQGALLIGQLAPHNNTSLLDQLERGRLSAISLELLPRISRAQAMDVLSSQANIAGYKAVLLAAAALDRFMPMLMTAAGTVQPAKVVVIGAGVAGLQAVATARRLGAVVSVSDVRAAAQEQVESLGARFIPPPEQGVPGEAGGYAKQATMSFLDAQREGLSEHLNQADVVICTAQVPGRPAPMLITSAMVAGMRPGAVIVDLAVIQGGNCELSQAGQTVEHQGVQVIGADRLPSSVAHHASSLYSRNLMSLLEALIDKDGVLKLDSEDELLAPSLISLDGNLRRTDLVPERTTSSEMTP